MMRKNFLLALSLIPFLNACETLGEIIMLPVTLPASALVAVLDHSSRADEKQRVCRANYDWYDLGKRQGAAGANGIFEGNRYRNLCQGTGFPPDAERWQAGYRAGLAQYCTPARFRQRSEDGDRPVNAQVCPNAAELARIYQQADEAAAPHRAQAARWRDERQKLRRRLQELNEEGRQHPDQAALYRERRRDLQERIDGLNRKLNAPLEFANEP